VDFSISLRFFSLKAIQDIVVMGFGMKPVLSFTSNESVLLKLSKSGGTPTMLKPYWKRNLKEITKIHRKHAMRELDILWGFELDMEVNFNVGDFSRNSICKSIIFRIGYSRYDFSD
jgi:hypothetical protein